MSRLTASARILRADNGAEATCDELHRSGERPPVWSLDERKRLVARQVADVTFGERQETFTLRLASGRQLEATADSQLMTLDGWRRLEDLNVGDRLAVPRRVPEPVSTHRMAVDEVVLLAHMIGDGSCVKNQPIRYASIDEQSLLAVTNAAKHFGVTAKRDDYPAARVSTLRLPAPYHLTHGKRNPIAAWLDGLGLFGKRSYDKFVPAEVFAAPNAQVALFLRHLWATDGCVAWDAKQGIGRIYYGSTSRRLADDVRQLLLRFGISSRAYRIPKAGYRDCWNLHVSGVDNQRRFLRDIDAHGVKFFAVRKVLTNLAGVKSNDNVDTVPRQVWDQVRQGLSDQRMTHRAFAEAMQTRFCGSAMWKPSPSRGRLHRAAAILDDRKLHDLTNNDVFWDKVVEITSVGERDVYDIAVAGTDNLVAQGISLHTSLRDRTADLDTG
jgi:replicative DNA helicase